MVVDGGGNLFDLPANLGALADNGGPNQTHALLAGSAALDGGDPAFAADPTTDQRGLPRVANARIDIGAFEVQVQTPVVPPVGRPRPPRPSRPTPPSPARQVEQAQSAAAAAVDCRASSDSTKQPDTSSAPGSTISGQRRPRSSCTS